MRSAIEYTRCTALAYCGSFRDTYCYYYYLLLLEICYQLTAATATCRSCVNVTVRCSGACAAAAAAAVAAVAAAVAADAAVVDVAVVEVEV
eukprot:10843-Heterococcus_DN1.PRE.1